MYKRQILRELEERAEAIIRAETAGVNEALAINGKKVMEILGIRPGPELGKILSDLRERVTDNPGLNNEKELIRILREEKAAK